MRRSPKDAGLAGNDQDDDSPNHRCQASDNRTHSGPEEGSSGSNDGDRKHQSNNGPDNTEERVANSLFHERSWNSQPIVIHLNSCSEIIAHTVPVL